MNQNPSCTTGIKTGLLSVLVEIHALTIHAVTAVALRSTSIKWTRSSASIAAMRPSTMFVPLAATQISHSAVNATFCRNVSAARTSKILLMLMAMLVVICVGRLSL